MRPKALLAAAAAALLLAACNAADSTGQPAAPSADGGTGMFGSGGFTPPPDTIPHP
jgi:opacity protein-like surface antigen